MDILHLPGITKAGFCKAINLQPDLYDLIDELKVTKVYGTFTDIPLATLGGMSIKSEIIKGVTVYTVKVNLRIHLPDQDAKELCLNLAKNDNAFYFQNVNGQKMLVGTHEKPHPTVSHPYQNDDTPTGLRCFSLEITYQNTHSFLVLE